MTIKIFDGNNNCYKSEQFINKKVKSLLLQIQNDNYSNKFKIKVTEFFGGPKKSKQQSRLFC